MTLQCLVAIKIIDPAIASSAAAVSRFLREARAAASLRSPHVVQIIDHGVSDGVPYVAMELLEGETLADRLSARGSLTAGEAVNAYLYNNCGTAGPQQNIVYYDQLLVQSY